MREVPPAIVLRILTVVVLGGPPTGACEAGTAGQGAASAVEPVEILLGEPVADIGEIDGDPDYLLHKASGAVRLSDGRLAVLNAGTQEVRIYDGYGRHDVTVGGEGSGPGEMRAPARIRLTAGDSILVLDQATNLESGFTPNGEFTGVESLEARHEPPFAGDTWLHGRNYVIDPAGVTVRDRIGVLLDRLPAPGPGSWRYVRVDRDGRLWIRTEPADPAAPSRWDVRSTSGARLASIITPAGFHLLDGGRDFVLGRVLDEVDVEHVTLYEFAPIDEPVSTAGGRSVAMHDSPSRGSAGPQAGGGATVPAVDDAIIESMQSLLRHAMMQQEIYYSMPANGYRYASSASQLEWPDDMRGLTVHVLDGSDRGWTMIVVHEAADLMCGVAVGGGGPIGWTPGIVLCPAG